jgi:MFS family permease
MTPDTPHGTWIETDVPPRLDALGWSSWHRRFVIALGITWILDGLEASLIANLGPTLRDARTLGLSAADVGTANTAYLIGQVLGALVFGWLTDRMGRKKLFLVTLGIYLVATALSGFAPNFGMFLVFRFFAGAGIGGEYAAINSAIDELVPARVRGRVDLAINGSYWVGVLAGAALTLVMLDPAVVPLEIGWRVVFALGSVLGLGIVLVRRHMPESPRWLLNHGYVAEAKATLARIEDEVHGPAGQPTISINAVRFKVRGPAGLAHVARVLVQRYPRRTVLGVVLMLAQAFLYNAIFFSYGLILEQFHGVAPDNVGRYIMPFAVGNFLGPIILGRYFDVWGRRAMITLTYGLSGILLLATGALFYGGYLNAITQTICWSVVFFVASAAASSAYLTVSELFPLELRGMAIALFYAFGTLVAAGAPRLFGWIVDTGSAGALFAGYGLAAFMMIAAALVARWLGVNAEGKSLEELTTESD